MGELGLGIGRKLRYGMIGGGPGAFIGAVHRRAAALDGDIDLVAGSFSSVPERSIKQGSDLLLEPTRVYASYVEMVEAEALVDSQQQLDFVSVVTPNGLHFEVAKAFLEAGFAVVCDKPLTTTLQDAVHLASLVQERSALFAVTYNYSGYPMVRQAREMVANGDVGEIRKVVAEYSQGWLTNAIERDGQKQASWRSDPQQGGAALALGDIGTHAEHLTRYITGLGIERVFADLTTFVPGRQLEDDANVLIHLQGGARGVLCASQVAAGEENNLILRVYGSRASLEWRQENPNYLLVNRDGGPTQRYSRGNPYLGDAAVAATRLPPGHPEGFIEAFANVYGDFARAVAARQAGTERIEETMFPTVHDGLCGVQFVHAAVASHEQKSWIDIQGVVP